MNAAQVQRSALLGGPLLAVWVARQQVESEREAVVGGVVPRHNEHLRLGNDGQVVEVLLGVGIAGRGKHVDDRPFRGGADLVLVRNNVLNGLPVAPASCVHQRRSRFAESGASYVQLTYLAGEAGLNLEGYHREPSLEERGKRRRVPGEPKAVLKDCEKYLYGVE